jgi:hypothetical protein
MDRAIPTRSAGRAMNRRPLAAALTTAALITAPVACSSQTGNQVAPISVTPAPSTNSAVPTSGPTINVGQTTQFPSQFAGERGTTIRLTVTGVAYVTSVTDALGVNTPTRGLYARVTMTATNIGTNPGVFDDANFVWISPQGQAIPNTACLGAAPDTIPTVTMQPGQNVSGVASYDVPARGGQLQYEIGVDLPVSVTVDLPSS